MSARGAVAQQQGVDEEMLAEVDHYEESGLSPFQQAALRLADSYLTAPADTPDEVRGGIAERLDARQAVELVLKLMGFSSDKALIALGIDFDEVKIFTM